MCVHFGEASLERTLYEKVALYLYLTNCLKSEFLLKE